MVDTSTPHRWLTGEFLDLDVEGLGRDETEARTLAFAGVVVLGFTAGLVVVGNLVLILSNGTLPAPLLAIWALVPILAVASTLYATHWTVTRCRPWYLLYVGVWMFFGAVLTGVWGGLSAYFDYLAGVGAAPTLRPFLTWAGAGVMIGGLVGGYDATRRMREAETERARRRAEELAETLSVLNRVLRHDIRNDANVIQGYVDLIERDADVDDDYLEPVNRRVADILELADHARQAEQLVSEGEPALVGVDVAERVGLVVDDVGRIHPSATIETSLPASARVEAHELLDSALYNLVENAVEHNPADEPWVRVGVERRDGGVLVEVADDGPGIPEPEVAVLETGGESALEHSSGTGLWLVHWIVQRSGGSVSFHENDPAGSLVRVWLPT